MVRIMMMTRVLGLVKVLIKFRDKTRVRFRVRVRIEIIVFVKALWLGFSLGSLSWL